MRKLLAGTSVETASDTKGDINQEEPIIIVEDIYFPALQADEVLDLIVAQDGTKDSFGVSGVVLTVAAKSGDTARELFTVEARVLDDMSGLESRVREITKAIKLLYSVPKDTDSKSMVFVHTIRQQPLGGNLAAIWYVDGNSGFAKKLETYVWGTPIRPVMIVSISVLKKCIRLRDDSLMSLLFRYMNCQQ